MSELRGWSHDEMMKMDKKVFMRYYGYWYADQINEYMYNEWMEHKRKIEQKSQENRRTLGIN